MGDISALSSSFSAYVLGVSAFHYGSVGAIASLPSLQPQLHPPRRKTYSYFIYMFFRTQFAFDDKLGIAYDGNDGGDSDESMK